jgi:hypothetical protein
VTNTEVKSNKLSVEVVERPDRVVDTTGRGRTAPRHPHVRKDLP